MNSFRKDWYIIGSLAGATASLIKTSVNYALYKKKLSDTHYVDIAGSMVLGKRKGPKPRKPLEKGIGFVADTILGTLFGASLAFLIGKTPKGNDVLKGTIFGTSLWEVTLSLGALLQIGGLSEPSPKTMASMLTSSAAFGAGTGYLLKKYAHFDQAEIQQPSTISFKHTNNPIFEEKREG